MDTAFQERRQLVDVLRETQAWLSREGNDFSWSSWSDAIRAHDEIDQLIQCVEGGRIPTPSELDFLFAPTGPIQEVSVSSGWGYEFLELANRFDAAAASARQSVISLESAEGTSRCQPRVERSGTLGDRSP
jgi:hypothetical protein